MRFHYFILLLFALAPAASFRMTVARPHALRRSSNPLMSDEGVESADPAVTPADSAGADEGEPTAAAEASAPVAATPDQLVNLFRVPEVPADKAGPTLPVSSTADKIKGFAGLLVLLVASGWILNYSFSANSPLLAPPPGERVNEGLVKYATPLQKAAELD